MVDVIQVSSDYFPNIGGVATHVHELARGLQNNGHRVEVVTFDPATTLQSLVGRVKSDEIEGVHVRRVGLGSLPGGRLRYWRLRQDAARLGRSLGTRDQSRVVHVHDMDIGHNFARHLPSDLRVFTNHTSGFLQDLDDSELRADWRTRLDSFDHIIAPSSELRDRTVDLGIHHHRVTYVPNGVDPEKFRPNRETRERVRARLGIAPDQVVVLSTRRFVPKNGVIDLAHSLRLLAGISTKVSLVFAGNGFPIADPLGYEKETLAAIRQSPLASKTKLLGAVPNDAIAELYAAADVSVLPSLKEATSISGLEAMSTALPLVGTRVGGIPDLVKHGETGLLVEPGDPRGLADAITHLVMHPDERREFGARARAQVLKQFAWSEIARRTVQVYEEALRGKHSGSADRHSS